MQRDLQFLLNMLQSVEGYGVGGDH